MRTCGFDPRSGYHDIQQLATFYLTENPLQLPNSAILFASSRYLLITRIPGYKIKVRCSWQNSAKTTIKNISSPQRYLTVKKSDAVLT